jgi:hypothetical protein
MLFFLVLLSNKVYANIDFRWNLGEIGFDYSIANNEINIGLNFLQFNWIETNTGIGFNFALLNGFKEKAGPFASLLPVEIMLTPISYRSIEGGFVNWTIYDKLCWAGGKVSEIGKTIQHNIVGIRISGTTLSLGRNKVKKDGHFFMSRSIFFEYDTIEDIFRIGIHIDYGRIIIDNVGSFFPKEEK